MNPELHHEFETLCALYTSGEISEEEWALLQIHMGYCDSCHEKFLQYQQIAADLMPVMAAAAALEAAGETPGVQSTWNKAERSLISRVKAPPSTEPFPAQRRPNWRLLFLLAAACAVGIACLFGVRLLLIQREASSRVMPAAAGQPGTPPHDIQTASNPDRLENDQVEIESLNRQVVASEDRLKRADAVAAALRRDLNTDHAALDQLNNEKNTLTQQLASARTELDSMRNRLQTAGSDVAEQGAQRAALETRVRELQASLAERDVALGEKDQMLALDKDFLAHDRDIRDLIGARNLYIADIFDTTENGRTAREFGRIFYTKDRSLIFYGFDLDSQAGRKRDVSFQVWGSGSDISTPVSLGLFYQDDSHKRWVLRCNDPKTLARLDMVFVTVEPPGGSDKPTGKQLLRAYLQIHPNHP